MMHQVSPEDRLAVVTHQQAEWRAQSARERMAAMRPKPPASRRSRASVVRNSGSYHIREHALQLLHALLHWPGGRPKRSAH